MENFVLRWLGREKREKGAHMPLKLLHLVWGEMSCDLPAWWGREQFLTRAQEAGLCPAHLPGEADYCLGGRELLCLSTPRGQEYQEGSDLWRICGPPSMPFCPLSLWRGRVFAWGNWGRAKVIGLLPGRTVRAYDLFSEADTPKNSG